MQDFSHKTYIYEQYFCMYASNQGLYPDYMHIVHLACGVDAMASIIMDLVENEPHLIAGTSKEKKLETLWINYRQWAESSRYPVWNLKLSLVVCIFICRFLLWHVFYFHNSYLVLSLHIMQLRNSRQSIPQILYASDSAPQKRFKTLRSVAKNSQCNR